MSKKFILVGMLAVFVFSLSGYARAAELKMAPLNPEFAEMIETSRRGVKKPLARTVDGHGLGLLPAPLDFSRLTSGREPFPGALRAVTNVSYDLRELGRLTSVRDQGDYGTCWAFATYGSLESCLLYSGGGSNDFSENNLANLAGFDFGFDDGGFAEMSIAYLARWGGPVNEADDPYPNPGGSSVLPPVKHVQSVEIIGRRISSLANDAIKAAIVDRGPLWVGMSANNFYFYYNPETYAFFKATPESTDHAVAVVGWDDAFSRTNFAEPQPSNDGAFIVRNSWGTNFGDNGYFYVSYDDRVFARSASYLFLNGESTGIYSQVYQYDPLGWVSSMGYSADTAWGANVFTVTNSGELKAVSFYASSTNASYGIYIYTDVAASQPRSGTLHAYQTGSLTNAGYYTVVLSSPIGLAAGRNFSVAARIYTPDYTAPVPVEYALDGYSSRAAASPGESFMSADGAVWLDTTDYEATMNVCIKAFLQPASAYPYSPPATFTATDDAYSNKIYLAWSHAHSATGYALYRNTSDSLLTASRVATRGERYYEDYAVTPGVVYYYWIKTLGASGSSYYSLRENGSASLLPPSVVSASEGASADKVQLSWNAASGAAGYIVFRNQTDSSNSASELARSTALAYNDTSAAPGSIYYYWLKSYSPASTSSFSSGAAGYRKFAAPTGVAASDGAYATGVRISWNAVGGALSYRILRGLQPDSSSAVVVGETADASYLDTSASAGVLYYYWVQARKWSVTGSISAGVSGWRRSMAAGNNARGDFDGDGLMDLAVYQRSTGRWLVRFSGSFYATGTYQLDAGCLPVPGDYDGDSRTDPAVYQSSDGKWTALLSTGSYLPLSAFMGGDGFEPEPGDYDGDGFSDLVAYQEGMGLWKGMLSGRGYALISTVYGGPDRKAVAADYDGDGLIDPAYYYELPAYDLGYWYMALSGSGYASYCKTTTGVGYVPVPADYDGDAKADLAVYDHAAGVWKCWSSAYNYPLPVSFNLGGEGYTAVPGDYDGDTCADIAVYHEASGCWRFLLSAYNYAPNSLELGGPGYEPVGAAR
ncbi:MAG: lectin like domain-containing protein [Kiritimatiellae bacterium]|nr:lectin like domain-containing protein [Kiritimatiellia bacterium]